MGREYPSHSGATGTHARPYVVHIVPVLYGPSGRIIGGAERYAFELARHMAERVPTRLVSFGTEARDERHGALAVRIIGGARHINGHPYNPFARQVVPEMVRADIVHCHQQNVFVARVAATLRRATRRRAFVTDHGGGAWDFSSRFPATRWFDGYLHVSEFSRRSAGQEHEPRAQVIHGGVDLDLFSPPSAPTPRSRALFVGRLLPHKGVDTLIEALPPGVGLDVAGTPLDERYRADLEELARGRDVRFHHHWDDAKVREAYRSAACLVLPSVYRDRYGGKSAVPELLGQTLLEGMACATPVICTAVGGMPEVVEDGVTGFVVPPGDVAVLREKLAALVRDPDAARRMGLAGHDRVRRVFTWDVVVRRCLQAYDAAARTEHGPCGRPRAGMPL
jgi:glycosyltransferase involved in cell wall biosynthesis